MEIITRSPFINCKNCGQQTNKYYLDIRVGKVCYKCLLSKNNNSFPKGKGVTVPCQLCKEPNIHWIHKKTYGKNPSDCGNHDDVPLCTLHSTPVDASVSDDATI